VNEKDPERDRYLGVEDLFRQEEEEEESLFRADAVN